MPSVGAWPADGVKRVFGDKPVMALYAAQTRRHDPEPERMVAGPVALGAKLWSRVAERSSASRISLRFCRPR
jgi:hypothetical protein